MKTTCPDCSAMLVLDTRFMEYPICDCKAEQWKEDMDLIMMGADNMVDDPAFNYKVKGNF